MDVDGEAELDLGIDGGRKITFYFCNAEAAEALVSGQVVAGDEVEISAYYWDYGNGKKFVVGENGGYIKKHK